MDEEKLIDLLVGRTEEHASKNEHKYILEVAVWISKIFLTETQTDITHDYDPPWDSSGTIYDTEKPFNADDYTNLFSFTENEFNGDSHPSFESGMGIFHDCYSDELNSLTDDWIQSQLGETVKKLVEEDNQLLTEYAKLREEEEIIKKEQFRTAEEITELLNYDDILSDFIVFDYPVKLKEIVGKMEIKFLLKIGHKQAKEEIKQVQILMQKNMDEHEINQKKAEKYWAKICKLHKLRYQKAMPSKVEKAYYDQYVSPILEDEYDSGEDVLNIRLLGQYLGFTFSHSVAFILSQFKGNDNYG